MQRNEEIRKYRYNAKPFSKGVLNGEGGIQNMKPTTHNTKYFYVILEKKHTPHEDCYPAN